MFRCVDIRIDEYVYDSIWDLIFEWGYMYIMHVCVCLKSDVSIWVYACCLVIVYIDALTSWLITIVVD